MNTIPTQGEVKSYIDCYIDADDFKSYPQVDRVSIDNAGNVTIQANCDTMEECNAWERVLRKCANHYGRSNDCEIIITKEDKSEEELAYDGDAQDYYYEIECSFETI